MDRFGGVRVNGFPLALQEIARSTAEGRFELFGVAFADPWFLATIPIAIAFLWRGRESRRQAAARVPTIGVEAEGRSGRGASLVARLAGGLPFFLRVVSVTLIAIALSRPLEGRVSTSTETEGIDIALLLDRSSSMEHRENSGSPRRFDIVRGVIADFATRRMNDEEGARDNVGLFGFAGYTDLLVPFTLDSQALLEALEDVEVESERWLDGTAIGNALAGALDVLRDSPSKSRIVILLTDGEETSGDIPAMQGAKAAAELGIRVYTVFAGPREVTMQSLFGDRRVERTQVGDLPAIAETTGGKFFHAESRGELEAAYEAIEALERTPRTEERFAERYDLYPKFLTPALVAYLFSVLLGATVARRIP